ncbi:MAG TPA: dienelactone hydrolase family protein [Tepidisphaeraceae bacterium]|jgi:carboxymethylenebutenolidase|nr:dienelactone hydrolase family protein [Tepidisphaeraceae bacterium]
MKISALAPSLLMVMFAQPLVFAAESGSLPPGEKEAKATLDKSPRHGEWLDIGVPASKTPLKSYIVYPERKDKAPVVIVIHEIFGQTDWIRSVADQLAADGFIAIAPDLLSGHGKDGGGTDSYGGRDDVIKAIRGLKAPEVTADLNAVREYGLKLPAASEKSATVGFCWGGGQSFAYAVSQPELNAAVVYYGTPPSADEMAKIKAPVLGLYGGNDARVTSTVEPTTAEMKKLDKAYTPHVFEGAGHGFLRAQDGQNGANLKAAESAWPQTIAFLKKHTSG